VIFTRGDLVQHFQSDSKISERLLADQMTLNPVTAHKDKLAVEVLNLLERHPIDEVVVIDESNVTAPAARQDRCSNLPSAAHTAGSISIEWRLET